MRLVIEVSPEKAQATATKVAQTTGVIVSSLFALTLGVINTSMVVGKEAYKQIKEI